MKICYINFNLNSPRDQITLQGLRENGIEIKEIVDNTKGWKKYLNIAREYLANRHSCDLLMVGYTGSVLVILMRFFTRKKIVYNALATFYDSMIVSRQEGRLFSPLFIWYYLIDFFAFHLANQSFVECQTQKDLITRIFLVNPEKISVHFVGTDDRQFFYDSAVSKLAKFTVVFRGMFLPEAGADVVILAAKELENENIDFRILGRGLLISEIENLLQKLKLSNVELITERLPMEVLRNKMLECHLSLGQLANHPRVHTTIPHKAFESMAMKLPYLTGKNKGVLEVLTNDKTCFTVSPGDHHELAKKITELKNNLSDLDRIAENAYRLYQQEFTPKVLARKIIETLQA